MLRRLDLTGFDGRPDRGLLPRAQFDIEAAAVAIAPIVHGVRDHGYQAARAASLKFDGVDVADPRVSPQALAHALATVPDDVRAALIESIRRARIGHEAQRRQTVRAQIVPGGSVTEKWIPVERVGLYAPGGVTALPSSVIMNVVPAQIAGVASLAVFSPPQREFAGLPHPTVLAACALLGIDEVYAVGGAQAIALMAYGDADIGLVPVDMATGPGNVYTTAAKRMLRAVVGIDSEAGTTEIAVLADAGADPGHVAADLISQAEHDPNAASVLVTDSVALVAAVDAEIERQVPLTKHVDRVRAALSGPQSASVLVRDLDQGLAVVDAYAAEHLEIITANARAVAERVRNAGAIFVGTWSPVSLGDYCAGSNHVLPTACTARHSSGLSVQTFLRGVHLIEYTEAALAQAAPFVLALSAAEDLPAHGAAVSARFPNSPTPRP